MFTQAPVGLLLKWPSPHSPNRTHNVQVASTPYSKSMPRMSFGLTPVAYTGWIRQHECGKPLAKRWYAGVHDSKVFALREWRFL